MVQDVQVPVSESMLFALSKRRSYFNVDRPTGPT